MQKSGAAGDDLHGVRPRRRARRASASASRLASKTSTAPPPLQCRPSPPRLGAAAPHRRRGDALVVLAGAEEDLADLEQRDVARSARRALRSAAATRPGTRLGRMSERSAAIGLASASAGAPPPNSSAAGLEMNDQVTASRSASAASARLASRVRFCSERQHRLRHAVVEPRQRGQSARGRGRRCARSARRRRPCPRCRAARWARSPCRPRRRSRAGQGSPRPRRAECRRRAAASLRYRGRRTARSRRRRIARDDHPRRLAAADRERRYSVARSQPGTQKSGSTPRSKR